MNLDPSTVDPEDVFAKFWFDRDGDRWRWQVYRAFGANEVASGRRFESSVAAENSLWEWLKQNCYMPVKIGLPLSSTRFRKVKPPERPIVRTTLVRTSKGQFSEVGSRTGRFSVKEPNVCGTPQKAYTHQSVCRISEFNAILAGEKTFEVYRTQWDPNQPKTQFKQGDTIRIREYDFVEKHFTGNELSAAIGCVMEAGDGIAAGYCAVSFLKVAEIPRAT